MIFPEFFAHLPSLTLRDPLAEILGAAQGGVLEYRYEDVVRLAGHSCPTVAGAWLMARHGLAALYPEGLPERGGIRVELRGALEAGTTGVVGNVLSFLTGAAGEGGFKGLGGRYGRCNLLAYGVAMPCEVRFIRLDSGASVGVDYHPERVPPAPDMPPLMARVIEGTAGTEEREAFGRLWQDRVRRILVDHADDPNMLVVRPGA